MAPHTPSTLTSLLAALDRAGITHAVGLPDNTSAPLFDALAAGAGPTLVTATREGEAVALAAGLWLGGARPLVVCQNTGLLEAGDSLRGTAGRMGVPLPLLVTGRGYAKMRRAGLAPGDPLTRALLTRPDVDSVALLTEPTLAAWGIPFEREDPDLVTALERAVAKARTAERPVAALWTSPLEGA